MIINLQYTDPEGLGKKEGSIEDRCIFLGREKNKFC